MRSSNRISGIDIIGNVPWGTHFCQFYQTKEDLIDILIPYFKTGLENNEFCLWVIPEQLNKEEAKEALKVGIPDINIYLENGQIEILPYTDWHVKEGILDPQTVSNHLIEKTSKALASGYDGLRYSGNDFFGHRKILDSVIGKYPMIALCTYSLDMCSSIEIVKIATNHQFALGKKKGKWERVESSEKNINNCKQTEKTLQESEEWYKAIFDNSLDGIIFTTPDGTILAANPAACQMFGMTEEELIQAGRKGVVDISDSRLKSLLEERARAGRFKGELNYRRKDGTIFPGEISSAFFKDKDGLVKGVMIIRDISERKQLEEQTLQRAEEMEAIMEVVPIPILIGHDPQGQNITGNRMANEFYEAEAGENISAKIPKGRRFFYKGRELSTDELPVQQAALKDIDVRNVELDILLPSGKLRTTTISASPLHNAEGKVRSSVGAFVDITERKKVEAKLKDTLNNLDQLVKERTLELQKAYVSLKKSERNLAEAQEMAHIGSWERDIVSNEYSWSDELYRVFGLKPQESKANYDTFLNCVHPDDRNYVNNAVKEALKGKLLDTNFRIIRANGEERIAHAKAEVVFDEKNNPVRIRGTTQDITEHRKAGEKLRESEERYRNIVETANEGIIIIDDEAKVIYANNKLTDMLGYTLEEGIGRPIWDFANEEGKTILKQKLEKRRQGVNESYELKLICKDGSLLWALINAKSLFDKYGKFVGSLSMLTDITERKKAEEALADAETARKKEIHHRIKNNLQVISSLLDLQAEQFRKREYTRDSEVLEAFRESQDRVISMALIHEELYKGGGFETLNFSPYIEELADTLFHTYRLGNTDISLSMDLEENLSFNIDTAVPLGIIVNELVSNSLKHAFIGKDKGEIRIKFHREESTELESEDCKSTTFILSVADNGVGIPENLDIEDLDSLGMQLVTSLVDQLDGELELKRGNGTEFSIRFS